MKTAPITKVTGLSLELTLEEARRLQLIAAHYWEYASNWGIGNREDQQFANSLTTILSETIKGKP